MADDWKSKLQQLADTLPAVDVPSEPTATESAAPVKLPVIEIVYERKGRAGKPATIAIGFDADDEATLKRVASALKSRLACGGSARGGEILIQGDRRKDVADYLRSLGYKVKGA